MDQRALARETVGRVQALFIYPVKSMRGIEVPQLSCHWYGANGDRKYAFTQTGDLSGFPWLTARELPALLQYQPYLVDPTSPLSSAIRVRTPDKRDLALEAPELIDELAARRGAALSLLKLKRGTFDAMPLSLFTSATLAELERAAGRTLDVRRFRPNIFIEGIVGTIEEEAGIHTTLVFGESEDAARIQIHYPTKRCVMINLDPQNGEPDHRVLKTVAATRKSHAGVYASVSRPGTIHMGDAVYREITA